MATASSITGRLSVAPGCPNLPKTWSRRSPRHGAARAVRSGVARSAGMSRSPQALRGFVDLVDHPWVRAVSEAVLGPDYQIVEVGFDIPFAGAVNQPWHRDFPSPPATRRERRLTSLAFNVTCVDTEADMGPFEVAPGTQWEPGTDFEHGMFPPRSEYARYEQRAVRKFPQMGDISARSALTIHRGTKNHTNKARPVLVLGMGRAGRRQRRESRYGGDPGFLGRAGPARTPASGLPDRRPTHPDHTETHHRRSGDGRGRLRPDDRRSAAPAPSRRRHLWRVSFRCCTTA